MAERIQRYRAIMEVRLPLDVHTIRLYTILTSASFSKWNVNSHRRSSPSRRPKVCRYDHMVHISLLCLGA